MIKALLQILRFQENSRNLAAVLVAPVNKTNSEYVLLPANFDSIFTLTILNNGS
jgi:hypothetical protein